MKRLLRQAQLVHISDVHFGRKHICAPAVPGGSMAGVADLAELIRDDLETVRQDYSQRRLVSNSPNLLFVATGDLTETASAQEFECAEQFLRRLVTDESSNVALDKLFVVPGNHDVVFIQKDLAPRWQPYCAFYSGLFQGVRAPILDRNATMLSQVHDRSREGLVVAEINSALYVHEGSEDASRGQVDGESIARLRGQLAGIDQAALKNSIKIGLMHHHPVLLPSLVEAGRGYDAIANSHSLLRLLQEFGFHVVLHGHKHYPQTFSYDPDYAWSTKPAAPPLLIVAGGSTGSEALPLGTRARNSYNIITIKWHPEARQGRVRVETRGLKRVDDDGVLSSDLWDWETLYVSDRILAPNLAPPKLDSQEPLAPIEQGKDLDRATVYATQRGNMAVAEVMPSLVEGQAYEVRVWIVPHHERREEDVPEEVTWNAGWRFNRIRVTKEKDETFTANFSYWGSMLVEALMKFKDARTATAYVYARIPDGFSQVG